MESRQGPSDDSPCRASGNAPGTSPFELRLPEPSRLPVLISVPHGGRAYAPGFQEGCNAPEQLRRLEDRLVDQLAGAVAESTGAWLVVASTPRAVIDLNRGADDIDWGMVRDSQDVAQPHRLSPRARGGLGLVPRRLPGMRELWKEPLSRTELQHRIDLVHTPYHRTIEEALRRLRDRWGWALLIDLHSMPPLGRTSSMPAADFVVGDRFGASCDGLLTATAFDYFARMRQRASHNRPYAGGYILDRHAAPAEGLHALQIEVCRSLYLDASLMELSGRFDSTVAVLSGLVRALGDETAVQARRGFTALAAE